MEIPFCKRISRKIHSLFPFLGYLGVRIGAEKEEGWGKNGEKVFSNLRYVYTQCTFQKGIGYTRKPLWVGNKTEGRRLAL